MRGILFRCTALVVIAAMYPGCVLLAGAAVGAGSAVYVRGKLKDTVNHPVRDVHEAARRSLMDMGLRIQDEQVDDLASWLRSEFADGKDVRIYVDSITDQASEITIRVGFFGDRSRSQSILDDIKDHLANP